MEPTKWFFIALGLLLVMIGISILERYFDNKPAKKPSLKRSDKDKGEK